MNLKAPWIYNGKLDGIFILLPPFFCLALIFLFPSVFQEANKMSTASWVVLILLIDVAHVYSTIYRTYFDKDSIARHSKLFYNVPLIAWILFVLLYAMGKMIFWRTLAYLAVFHFIRQQYGFMRIYARKDKQGKLKRIIDSVSIYAATIYPLLYWHLDPGRTFNWFLEGDFFSVNSPVVSKIFELIYFAIIGAYVISEIYFSLKKGEFNFPKNGIVAGSFVSWYFGIVYFNADMAFTTLNVVSHGVPYMALIWAYGRKKYVDKPHPEQKSFTARLFTTKYILIFLLIIFLFAFVEEGLWDGLIWDEHKKVFSWFHYLPKLNNERFLAFLVPLLALPQITHYILDGFIWKIKKDKYDWAGKTLEQ